MLPLRSRVGLRGVLLLVLSFSASVYSSPTASQLANPTCATTTRSTGTYTITVCIQSPANNVTISGATPIVATVNVTGTTPGISKLIFSLNNAHLLTDYRAPYTFELPSHHFADGWQRLSAVAYLRDDSTTNRVEINLYFNNGNETPPINTNRFTPHTGSPPSPGEPFIVAATGDGASGETPQVTDLIASWEPDMFLYLGDVYEKGTYTEFYNWYGVDEFFGQFRDITNPTIGNHEYDDSGTPDYFDYWDNVPSYYSFDAAGWHFISLDSNLRREFEPGTAQYDWLVQELNAANAACSIAFFHHPLYSIGPQPETPALAAVWALLVEHGVDIVLTGHDHNYQRWQPLDGMGNVTSAGSTQFVIGSGGHGIRPFSRQDTRVAAGYDTVPHAYGALRLELYGNRAIFQYINIDNTVLDSGRIECDNVPLVPSLHVYTTRTPTLTWNRITWAAGYEIQVDNQPSFTSPEFRRRVDGSNTLSVTTIPLQNGRYYWRVRARRWNGTWGNWSRRDSFTIQSP